MDNTNIAKEWFDVAETDLSSAEFLQNKIPVPIEIICYHCQQCIEKYIKGFIILKGEEVPKTHDLILLNRICCKFDEDFKKIEDDCLMLTDYSVNVRYPFHIDLNESDAKIAIEKAKIIKIFILSKIEK